ncbi:MAG: endonuclease/exonuclease/phosphatase family protein [Fimbriimonadaceae bacterium]|nr:endonuclease/exonuclease/phosphatase family protein [Fimbriimonadaceae bacterium]
MSDAESVDVPESDVRTSRKSRPVRAHSIWLALILLDCLLYAFKPDILWALAILPVWVWSFVAWLCLLVSLRKRNWRRKAAWAGLWLIPVLLFSQEWISLGRGLFADDKRGDLRVISLNCEGGSFDAAKEVLAYKPDVVLFQETPSQPELDLLAKEIFGEEGVAFAGPDCSIVARGKKEAVFIPFVGSNRTVANATAALFNLGSGKKLLVVSLRLQPPVFNLNFISPDCWTGLAENRRSRRQELIELRSTLDDLAVSKDTLVIVGGDFNTPPDASVQNALRPWLEDSFNKAGVGWGNTGVNAYPLVRIDQIWHSKELTPKRVWAAETLNSDHRMVIADFTFNKQN